MYRNMGKTSENPEFRSGFSWVPRRVVSEKCVDGKQLTLAFRLGRSYRQNMPSNHTELAALKRLLTQADRILASAPELPENRTTACRECLTAALALTDDLVKQSSSTTSAAILGRKGGSTTAKRHGPEHYRAMAAKRKTHGGGRPRKESE
jgi:hypothetical protein